MKMDKELKVLLILFITFSSLLIIWVAFYVIDDVYIEPIADSRANTYCQENGFDQYKSYSRVGIWSDVPIGIKCEYAERYTDLGVRANQP